MRPDVKAQWVAALRSGKYSQTTGQLKNSSGYCCLGVLAEELGALVSKPDGDYACADNKGHAASLTHLSFELRADVGLASEEVSFLVTMNDEQRKTFPEIATYIEEHL